jgi:hypothetical protein
MNNEITQSWLKERIQKSNKQAAINLNKYTIQEKATQADLWDFVPCTYDDSCSCRKELGSTGHWKLKTDIQFEDFMFGFLRMFVDRSEHLNLIMAIDFGRSFKPEASRQRCLHGFTQVEKR